MSDSPVLFGFYVPPHPHPLLDPDGNEGYRNLRDAFDTARQRIDESDADLILVVRLLVINTGPRLGIKFKHILNQNGHTWMMTFIS